MNSNFASRRVSYSTLSQHSLLNDRPLAALGTEQKQSTHAANTKKKLTKNTIVFRDKGEKNMGKIMMACGELQNMFDNTCPTKNNF
jgi:hypothetical protein